MFLQNWVNPLFILLGRVIQLVRAQGARAAVVVPTQSSAWWTHLERPGAEGVIGCLAFPGKGLSAMLRPNGCAVKWGASYAIAFLDFSTNNPVDTTIMGAEGLPLALAPPAHCLQPPFKFNVLPPHLMRGVRACLQPYQQATAKR